jgi:F420H(2)-dependent quinone reductase
MAEPVGRDLRPVRNSGPPGCLAYNAENRRSWHQRFAGAVKDKRIPVLAEVADPEKRRALWTQLVASLPFYEQYQRKTTREIPMVILHPAEKA